ncbi:receptor-interacting serine/threonine-protein kinase 3-like isoform X2 [Oryzias latipes]
MFKKKDSKPPSVKMSMSQPAIFAQLIPIIKKHANVVEKNILQVKELLTMDAKNSKKKHQKEVSDKLGEGRELLKVLFQEMDKTKELNHPQAQEIERGIIQLNKHWLSVCSFYQDVYEKIDVSPVDKTASGPVVVQNELPTLFRNMMGANNQINMFDDDSLLDWTEIGKGGFGSVYKARHNKMGHDVAIKILHDVSVEESLFEEAKFQKLFSCKFVLRVYGMYKGIPPYKTVKQEGIVMEFMTRGSIMDLCKNLRGPPPFPLACRLIQDVASGMRFLHLMGILHRDLKMPNVMLSEGLHAKLADFGLCTMSATCCPSNEGETENLGTLKYTPPEAYDINYKPVRSFDVYSFAIFLWVILSGEEPFPTAHPTRLRKCVAKGQRPTLEELSKQDKAGMNDLLVLMQKCWNGDPTQRPTFGEITPMVENVYAKHKSKIIHEVYEVLKQLDSDSGSIT